jgi:hypothetical protein
MLIDTQKAMIMSLHTITMLNYVVYVNAFWPLSVLGY